MKPHIIRTTFVLALLFAPLSGHADFKLHTFTDEFDGKVLKRVIGTDGQDRGSVAFWLLPAGSKAGNWQDAVMALIKPTDAYICGDVDGTVEVESLAVVGGVMRPKYTATWYVSDDRSSIFAADRPANRIASDLEEASEVRLRFTDTCGKQFTFSFSSAGYKGAAKEAGLPQFMK